MGTWQPLPREYWVEKDSVVLVPQSVVERVIHLLRRDIVAVHSHSRVFSMALSERTAR